VRTSARLVSSWPILLLPLLFLLPSCASINYLRDADPVNSDLTIHVVIENPVGTNEKWEVLSDGRLVQEFNPDGPVTIPYLPWPANAGMIPRTLFSAELGGDGEPLDVLVLGPSVPRGSLVRAVPIGLLHIVDRLERDDKILAIVPGTPLAAVEDIAELDTRFPGVRQILTNWYTNSRPGSAMDVQGFGSRAAARQLIAECAQEFDTADRQGEMPSWQAR
jgi:inorganic pyrophosphatase